MKWIKKFLNLSTATRHNIISLILTVAIAIVLANVKNTHFGAVYVLNTEGGAYNLPIIMYHSVLDDSSRASKYVITPQTLKEDMEYLKNKGYTTVTTSELVEFTKNATPLPPKPIVISFDDGYFNNFSYVFPVLKETNQKAVLSVVGIYADNFSREGEIFNNNYSHATWSQIEEMHNSGLIEIENHSYDMHDLSRRKGILRNRGEDFALYKENLIKDTQRASSLIEKATNRAPQAYTYPFGAVSRESREIIQSLGFEVTYGCEEGVNIITQQPECLYDLKRFNRDGTKTTEEFFEKILN